MRVLFDIVHPAHGLFFVNPIRRLQKEGATIAIASRHKDVTCDVLDGFGFTHKPISRQASGTFGLALELATRDLAMLGMARRFRPDVMIGFGGVAISHVGKLTNIPAIAFYDSENATLQTRLTWPFITHLYVPEAYTGQVPDGRTSRFRGIKEAALLHPQSFTPSAEIAKASGWAPEVDNFMIRTVGWHANHDIGKAGWSDGLLTALVSKLSAAGRVHISSERPLPAQLERYRYRGAVADVHHLLGHCRGYVGESTTMAREAALLGTPAIYDGVDHPGVTQELELEGLIIGLHQPGEAGLMNAVDRLLGESGRTEQLKRRDLYLRDRPSPSEAVVEAIYKHARARPRRGPSTPPRSPQAR